MIVSDWILSLMMLIFGLFFLVFGVDAVSKGNYFGSVLLVFGSVSLSFVYQDYRNFKGFSNVKNYWLISHIQRIVGSFIAAFTAFLVNNDISFLPEIISWLLPTVIIVPFITLWRRKYEIKIDKNI